MQCTREHPRIEDALPPFATQTEGSPLATEAPPQAPSRLVPSGRPGDLRALGADSSQRFGPVFLRPASAAAPPSVAPFSTQAHRQARVVLVTEPAPDPNHPYVQRVEGLRRALEAFDLNPRPAPGRAPRLHVSDVGGRHGASVLRAAAGHLGLARGADLTLDVDDPDPDWLTTQPGGRSGRRFPERAYQRLVSGTATDAQVAELVETFLAEVVDWTRQRILHIRTTLPEDDRLTVVNASFAGNRIHAVERIAELLLQAPPDSPWGQRVAAAPGTTLARQAQMAIVEAIRDVPSTGALAEARAQLAEELAEARKEGILVVKALGNDFDVALEWGDPSLSRPAVAGVSGLVEVGAVDRSQGLAVAPWSSDGVVDLSATGVDLPVGLNRKDQDGTSFATPIVASVAWAAAALRSDLDPAGLEALLTDPRVLMDVPGTERDGQGALDPFAALFVARFPRATADHVRAARELANRRPPDGPEIQRLIRELDAPAPQSSDANRD